MTDASRTAICLLVDRSGSMRAIMKSAQDSINEFIEAQKARSGRTTIRIVQFDAPTVELDGVDNGRSGWYLVHCPSTPATDVPRFALYPRGMTALYDAMGRAIAEFGEELAVMPETERPGTVVFAVLTDGLENSSREHTSLTIQKIVREQAEKYAWNFVYLGANQDAILEGEKMGIPRHSSITYAASDTGTRAVMESFATSVASAASEGGPIRFSDADRKRAMEKD